mgnify:FL=1
MSIQGKSNAISLPWEAKTCTMIIRIIISRYLIFWRAFFIKKFLGGGRYARRTQYRYRTEDEWA